MTKLENEIKEAFEKDHINLTPQDILKDIPTSFVSKKRQISFKESVFLTMGNFAVAAAVLCISLISPLNYQESIEDSIENRDFASHIVGALGLSNFTTHFDEEPSDLLPEDIKNRALPPIAYLNYTYTNKDKINYSFSNQERHIKDQIYKVKETINDRFLDTQYDVFFRKKSDSSLTGFIFENKGTRSISLTPTFFMEINSIENNRDCFLDINFKPTDPKFENFTFNLKENYDTSIQFTLLNNQDEFFKCKLEHKDEYNLFTLSWRGLEDNILFKIYNKSNMNYDCVYSSISDPSDEMTFPYIFNNDGTIDGK